jgi:hypothetical protein
MYFNSHLSILLFVLYCTRFIHGLGWCRVTHTQIELVGCATGGIACAAWSPDFEVLAICTAAPTGTCPAASASASGSGSDDASSLLLMSADWTLLAEVAVSGGGGNSGSSSRGVALSWRGDGAKTKQC